MATQPKDILLYGVHSKNLVAMSNLWSMSALPPKAAAALADRRGRFGREADINHFWTLRWRGRDNRQGKCYAECCHSLKVL